MKRFLAILSLTVAAAACGPAPSQTAQNTDVQTINSVVPQPAQLTPPPMLVDEAPPPKPKVQPWETPKAIVFSPEDEKVRTGLPFTPAIAMDPLDGSKISIRAATPMLEYDGKFYYFSSEANKQAFAANPKAILKGGFTKL
jgi:YHS domain-containing protein